MLDNPLLMLKNCDPTITSVNNNTMRVMGVIDMLVLLEVHIYMVTMRTG